METINYKLKFLVLLLFVATSCSDSDGYTEFDPVVSPIELTGTFDGVDAITRAPLTTGSPADITFFRADEKPTATSFDAYAKATDGKIAATSGAITFTTPQYYIPNPAKQSKLVGIHPQEDGDKVKWTAASSTISFTNLDGETDVLCSEVATGSNDSKFGQMKFKHLLTQLEVSVVKQSGITPDLWGKITSITLTGAKSGITVTLTDPSTGDAISSTPSGDPKPYVLTPTSTGELTTDVKPYGYAMFPPVDDNEQLTLTVKTEKNEFAAKEINKQAYQAGTKYALTISFTATDIQIGSSTILPWESGTSGSGEIEL